MSDYEYLIEKNKTRLDKLNLPDWKPKGKVLIMDKECPYSLDFIEIKPVRANVFGMHGNWVGQIIHLIAGPQIELYGWQFGEFDKAVDWCIENNVRLISASINFTYSDDREATLKKYTEWGGVFCTSAGNYDGKSVKYPGSSLYTICVSATNSEDCDGPEIDATADSFWFLRNKNPGYYTSFSGTSGAQPVIAACILYIQEACPHWKIEDIRQFIRENSVPLNEEYERFFSFPAGFEKGVSELTKKDFIESILPGALKSYREQGILPSLTLAQACLESAYGMSGLAQKSKNLFGIKWSQGCGYDYDEYNTKEWDGSKYITVKAKFRRYDTYADSILDHGKILLLNRYKPVLAAKDYREAATQVQKCGYATDPAYTTKLINIIETYSLNEYDREGYKMFEDFDEVADWAKDAVEKAGKLGLMNGDGDGNFNPKANLTREEAAQLVVNLYNKLKGAD